MAILGKSLIGLPSSAIKKCPLRNGKKKVKKMKNNYKIHKSPIGALRLQFTPQSYFNAPTTPKIAQLASLFVTYWDRCPAFPQENQENFIQKQR